MSRPHVKSFRIKWLFRSSSLVLFGNPLLLTCEIIIDVNSVDVISKCFNIDD